MNTFYFWKKGADTKSGTTRLQINGNNVFAINDNVFTSNNTDPLYFDMLIIGDIAQMTATIGKGLWSIPSQKTVSGVNTIQPSVNKIGLNINGTFGAGTKLRVYGR